MIMGVLLSYSLAVSLVILLLFPVLRQIVNRCTSFRFNRIVIIGGMLLSIVIPYLINLDLNILLEMAPGAIDSPLITNDSTANAFTTDHFVAEVREVSFPWVSIAVIAYISGIIVLLCREIISYIRLLSLISRCGKIKRDGIIVCHLSDGKTAPFSWGNYVFLQDSESVENDTSIYLHEKAHTNKKHWIDSLFADLFCILLWYNPLAWKTKQFMKLNHELEADSEVINSGINTYDYQRMLVTKAIGMRAFHFANSFAADRRNFRKRVLAIGRKRSPRKTMLIALFALPSVAFSAFVLALPLSARFLATISEFRLEWESELGNNEIPDNHIDEDKTGKLVQATMFSFGGTSSSEEKVDSTVELPSPFKDQTALGEILKLAVSTIQSDKEKKVNIGIVVDEDGRVKEVVTDNPDDPLVKTVVDQALNGIKFEQMTDNGKPIQVRFNIPVTIKKTNMDYR